VTIEHFYQVKDKVMFGKKKLQMLSEQQKKYLVTYQAGKVFVATYFNLIFEKLMLSNEKLLPSTNEPHLRQELEAEIKMLLSGSVTCNVKYGDHASSAKVDLDEAKEIVAKMCEEYGMGSAIVATARDQEILLNRMYDEVKVLIEENLQKILKIEEILYERESVTKKEVQKLL
jgi:ATP-dependent Zn protease